MQILVNKRYDIFVHVKIHLGNRNDTLPQFSPTKMRFTSAALLLTVLAGSTAAQQELPITETDVFIQSGEVSASSIIIMARCNTEIDSKVTLLLNGEVVQESQAFAARDYTVSFKVENLDSNTKYTYQVKCMELQDLVEEAEVTSREGSFKTAPAADQEVAFNFVWAAE